MTTTATPDTRDAGGHQEDHADNRRLVEITINNVGFKIRPGRHSVAELKVTGGVPLADDLVQVIHGELKPLPDDGAVVIKGEEVFVSHPKDCASS